MSHGHSHKNSDNSNYTRIFILCGKTISSESIREVFDEFGEIRDFRNLKDRSGDEKGIIYITYTKPSEAAKAIEQMNGQHVKDSERPIKVILASDRSEGNVRDPDEEFKMRRLFIICPPKFEDPNVITEYFSSFGEISSVKMLPPKKGIKLAYVSFMSSYCAARALEECDPEFKAVFAQTKSQQMNERGGFHSPPGRNSMESGGRRGSRHPQSRHEPMRNYDYNGGGGQLSPQLHGRSNFNPQQEVTLYASLIPSLDSRQVQSLFNLAPGLQSCFYNHNNGETTLKYNSVEEGAFVLQRFNGFEYPPSCPINIFSNDLGKNGLPTNVPNIQNLVQTIEKATNLLQQAGLMTGGAPSTSRCYNVGGNDLPPRQQVLPSDTSVGERLFIVTSPSRMSDEMAEDIFSRFGTFISFNYVGNKLYGYARYGSSESAHMAIEALHKKTIQGIYIKVILADPPAPAGEPSKRKNTYDENIMGHKYTKFE